MSKLNTIFKQFPRIRSKCPRCQFALTHFQLYFKPINCFTSSAYSRQQSVTNSNTVSSSDFSLRDFERISEATLVCLLDQLDDLIQDHGAADQDVEYSSGVLTLNLGSFGTYVLNKQPPNLQIWLSSPISGPKRYDWDSQSAQWLYRRDGSSLFELLNREIPEAFPQVPISLKP